MANKTQNIGSSTFPAAASSGIVARRCVCMDTTTKGNVILPLATPVRFVGVTNEKISAANNVEVQYAGIAAVESDGTAVINPGDYLIIDAASDGRVLAQALADGVTARHIIGMCVNDAQVPATAGALVYVKLGGFVTFTA